jgi:hypothetical protein
MTAALIVRAYSSDNRPRPADRKRQKKDKFAMRAPPRGAIELRAPLSGRDRPTFRHLGQPRMMIRTT